ncbi:MAG TPA: UDP-galactopyranose mutase [Gaiellales bacterium]
MPTTFTFQEAAGRFDVVCLSHLRWDFAYQRPQHLMARWGRTHRVLFVEEPVDHDGPPRMQLTSRENRVSVAVPFVPASATREESERIQRELLTQMLDDRGIERFLLWMYTPMALPVTDGLSPVATVYDCMDELSLFDQAPPELLERERQLLDRADLVFTGGHSLYRAKREHHPRVHPFPSSVDHAHFTRAREDLPEPDDQRAIGHPRLGFFGVIDERLDYELIAAVADRRPDWQIVMVGPVVKIDTEQLPQRPNIHYLGAKPYSQLPAYLAGWDVALMPFAQNDATRFISPTKTLEYLAGGRPVVSTPIADVVEPYAANGLVHAASGHDEFAAACDLALGDPADGWADGVEQALSETSWDETFVRMRDLVHGAITGRERQRGRGRREPIRRFDAIVVGAGFAGATVARELAEAGHRTLVVDRRPHIAGNAFDHYDDAGVLVHKYGPHIFHTNSDDVFSFLSRFTAWRAYEHRVVASVGSQLLPMPINLDTVNKLYGLDLDAEGLRQFLAERAEDVGRPRTAEDVVVGTVGRELYELFFRGYTRKQWGLDPSQLDASVTARVPTRFDHDDRYFTDTHQAMPLHGYTRMFENMLDHPDIKVMLNTDYREVMLMPTDHVFFSGPVDEFFDFRYGPLPYRSIEFRFETHDTPQFQPAPVVNYPNDHPYTRITEFRYLTGQEHAKTTVVYEFPRDGGDPYYPVPRPENRELYRRYQELAEETPGVTFLGRLGTYRYYNMDQVVAQALKVAARHTAEPSATPARSRVTRTTPAPGAGSGGRRERA